MCRLWANGTFQVVSVGNPWFIREENEHKLEMTRAMCQLLCLRHRHRNKSPLPLPWKDPEGQGPSIHRCRQQKTLDRVPDAHPAHCTTTCSLTNINLNILPLSSTALTVSVAEGELCGWHHRLGSSPGAVICSAVPLTVCIRLNRRSGTYRKSVSKRGEGREERQRGPQESMSRKEGKTIKMEKKKKKANKKKQPSLSIQ